jgi:outer membrane lipoprotein SlyB
MDTNAPREHESDEENHATTGGSAGAGAVTGGVVGAVGGGPVGAVVGAVGGAVVGAIGERIMHGRPGHEHIDGDEAHFVNDHEHTGDSCSHDHRFH